MKSGLRLAGGFDVGFSRQQPSAPREGLLVSVVIPTAGPGRWLLGCLDSLAAQTIAWESFEVVMVHNGPAEGTREAVAQWREEHSGFQLRWIEIDRMGEGIARNHGVDAARAHLLTFVDDDDRVGPTYLEELLVAGDEMTISAVFVAEVKEGDFDHPDFGFYLTTRLVDHLAQRGDAMGSCATAVWAKLLSTRIAREVRFNEGLRIGVDTDFMCRYLDADGVGFAVASGGRRSAYLLNIRSGSLMQHGVALSGADAEARVAVLAALQAQRPARRVAQEAVVDHGFGQWLLLKSYTDQGPEHWADLEGWIERYGVSAEFQHWRVLRPLHTGITHATEWATVEEALDVIARAKGRAEALWEQIVRPYLQAVPDDYTLVTQAADRRRITAPWDRLPRLNGVDLNKLQISVVIPAYESIAYLEECLDSLVLQSLPPKAYEVIVVLNGPEDGTRDLIQNWRKEHQEIRLKVATSEPAGVSRARNVGLALVAAPYVTFVDSDDSVGPQFLAALVEVAAPGVIAAVLDQEYDDGQPEHRTFCEAISVQGIGAAGRRVDLEEVSWYLRPSWAKAVDIDSARAIGFKEDLRTVEDTLFWFELLSRGQHRIQVGVGGVKSAYYYRRRRGSLMGRGAVGTWESTVPHAVLVLDRLAALRGSVRFERVRDEHLPSVAHFCLNDFVQQNPSLQEAVNAELAAVGKKESPPAVSESPQAGGTKQESPARGSGGAAIERPPLAVVVPTYLGENRIARCLDDLARQTLDPGTFEIVVVSNGPQTRTPLIVSQWAQRHPEHRVTTIETDIASAQHARNLALDSLASGWVTFVDDDDHLQPRYLEALWDAVEPGKIPFGRIGIVAESNLAQIHEESWLNAIPRRYLGRTASNAALWPAINPAWGKIAERSVIGDVRFDSTLEYADDTVFWMEVIATSGAQLKLTDFRDQSMYLWVQREGSITRSDVDPWTVHVVRKLAAIAAMQRAAGYLPKDVEACDAVCALFWTGPTKVLAEEPRTRAGLLDAVVGAGISRIPQTIADELGVESLAGGALVSVVIVTHNQGEFLAEAVNSALGQEGFRLGEVEVIVVDDGSTDDSASILRSFGSRITVIRQEQAGPTVAMYRALEEVRGEFVAFLDGDDVWTSRRLKSGVDVLRARPEVSLVHSDMEIMGAAGETIQRSVFGAAPLHRGHVVAKFLAANQATTSAITTRSDLLRAMPRAPHWVWCRDWWIAAHAGARGEIEVLPTPLVRYRRHGKNLNGLIGLSPRKKRALTIRDLNVRRLLVASLGLDSATAAELSDIAAAHRKALSLIGTEDVANPLPMEVAEAVQAFGAAIESDYRSSDELAPLRIALWTTLIADGAPRRHQDAPQQSAKEVARRSNSAASLETWCAVCETALSDGFGPGPNGRSNASCPNCGSLERHRFVELLLSTINISATGKVLEIAPSGFESKAVTRAGARCVTMDLGSDNRRVDALASLTQLPIADASVDLVLCSHVLEHVRDDRTAMREIARVLGPRGVGLVVVPFRAGTPTDEDLDAPVSERIRRFGQADHVRWYGEDFDDRLAEAGLAFRRVTPQSIFGQDAIRRHGLVADEAVWIVRPVSHTSHQRGGAADVPQPAPRYLSADSVSRPVPRPRRSSGNRFIGLVEVRDLVANPELLKSWCDAIPSARSTLRLVAPGWEVEVAHQAILKVMSAVGVEEECPHDLELVSVGTEVDLRRLEREVDVVIGRGQPENSDDFVVRTSNPDVLRVLAVERWSRCQA